MSTPRAERLGFAARKASFYHENPSSVTHWKQTNTSQMPHSGSSSFETSSVDIVEPKPKRVATNLVNHKPYIPENTVPRYFQPVVLHQQQDEPTFSAQSSLSLDLNYDESLTPLQRPSQAHYYDQFSPLRDLPTFQDPNEKANLRKQYNDSDRDALVFAVFEQYDPFSFSDVIYMEDVEPPLTAQRTTILEAPALEPLNIAMDLDYASFISNKKRSRSHMDGVDEVCGPSKKIKGLSCPTLGVFPTFISNSYASHLHPSLAPTVLELHDVPELSIPPPPPSPTFYSPIPLWRTKHQDHFLDDMSSLYSGVAEEFDDLLRNVRQKMSKKEVEVLVWNLASELVDVVDRAVGFDPVGMAISVA